jgi:predicted O-methyltransferase YrrM
MDARVWDDVDHYLGDCLVGDDPTMAAVLATNVAAGLPAIDVSPAQGQFLELLVRITRARKVLEVGTLGGYSTIWMARALPPDGLIVTLEYDPRHAAVAHENFERAMVEERIDLRVGAALDTLPEVAAEGLGPFDFTFIDADKANNVGYLDWAVKLSRPGSVIVLDNVIRDGRVIDASGTDRNVVGARAGLEFMGRHPRLRAAALQTVGSKGYDGFAIAIVI